MTTLQHTYQLAMEAGDYATRLRHNPAPGNIAGLKKAYRDALDRMFDLMSTQYLTVGDWNSLASIAQGRD